MADLRAETAGEGESSRDADALVIIKKIKNEYAEMKELAKTAGESQVGAAERAQLAAVKLGIELDKNNKKHDKREGTIEQAEERVRAASAKFYLAMDKLRDEASPLSKEDARGNEIDRIFDEELASYKKMLTSKGEFRAADYQLAVKTAETLKEYYKSNDSELLRSHNNFFDAIKAGYIELKREAQGLGDVIADSMKGAMEAAADAVAEFAVTGKLDFKSFTASVLADMSRMIVKQQALAFMNRAVKAVTNYFSGTGSNLSQGTATPAILNASTYSAKGNVFSGAGISAYSNTIVDKPTMFGKGGNLMGEAGPEAILPLTRLPGGNLGVESSGSSGGGLTIVNNINVDKGAGGADSEKEAFANRIARAVDQQVVETLAREKRYGGVLY
jgi:lambda family phage tail tape measure protein